MHKITYKTTLDFLIKSNFSLHNYVEFIERKNFNVVFAKFKELKI